MNTAAAILLSYSQVVQSSQLVPLVPVKENPGGALDFVKVVHSQPTIKPSFPADVFIPYVRSAFSVKTDLRTFDLTTSCLWANADTHQINRRIMPNSTYGTIHTDIFLWHPSFVST